MSAPAGGGSTWVVQAQQETVAADPVTGNLVHGMNLTIVTGLGQSGTVFVPNATLGNIAAVKAIVGNRAAQLDGLATLTSES